MRTSQVPSSFFPIHHQQLGTYSLSNTTTRQKKNYKKGHHPIYMAAKFLGFTAC
jgi:hypothetical protein